MTNRLRYTYSVLQYRHDTWTGEALNVGVAVFSPDLATFKVRNRRATGRILCAYPDVRRKVLSDALRAIERGAVKIQKNIGMEIEPSSVNANLLARQLVNLDDSSLFWNEGGSGTSKDFDQTVDGLFERFVSKFDQSAGRQLRTDDDVWKPVRDSLAKKGIANYFDEKTIHSDLDDVRFRSGWKNGMWNVIEPLSFDLTTADGITEKATRWTGHLYNLKGSSEKFRAHFVVGKPTRQTLDGAYDRALRILKESYGDPHIVEEESASDLIDTFANQISRSN